MGLRCWTAEAEVAGGLGCAYMVIHMVMEPTMETVSVADAKARLSEVIDRVLAGEPVQITRRGKPVVQLTAIVAPRPPVDVEALRRLTESMTGPELDSEAWWREYRDGDRY